ncbi:MAG: 5-(carboxyamino)imidazole ribonucleotide synthase [Acidimicrobiia bacterium]
MDDRYTPPIVAVLGGGQLGRMLGLAGIPLGLGFRFLDPSAAAPAQSLGTLVVGALDDEMSLLKTVESSAIVTYEWEGVPAGAARMLEARGHVVHPSTSALEVSQDRLVEKSTFRELGIPVAEFAAVDDLDDLHQRAEEIGLPAVLKTRRGGYDGKGQVVVHEQSELDSGFAALRDAQPLILEAFVPFERELSVLAVRSGAGEVRCWPLVENRHEDGILRTSRAPAPLVDPALQQTAEESARALLEHFQYVGVLALELFQAGDALLANEMAPRVHNSGHWTIEGAVTSQFENHLRAILGWPLGSTEARGVSGMVNLIGELPDPAAVLTVEGAHLHRYAKAPRPGRKVGHITVTASDAAELDTRLTALTAALPHL